MQNEKKAPVEEKNKVQDVSSLGIYEKLALIRCALLKADIKKTGQNEYSHFTYYELSDFLPKITEIAYNYKVFCFYHLDEGKACLDIINLDNLDDRVLFSIPLADVVIKGASGIQNVGGLTTYTRRYLYMIAFEISEHDEFDPNTNNSSSISGETEEQKLEREIEELRVAKIDAIKVKCIRNELKRTGVTEDAICKRYGVNKIYEITNELFDKVMKALTATKSINITE